MTFWTDVAATLARAALGTAAALALGAPIGYWIGRRPAAATRSVERLLDGIRSTPPIAVYPLFLVLFGYGEPARALAVVFGAIGLVVLETAAAASRAPAARREIFQILGAPRWRRLLWLDLPELGPGLALAARASMSTALVVVLVTEMLVGADHGLGTRLVAALLAFDTSALVLAILLVAGTGASVNALLAAAARRLTRWGPTAR